LDTKTGAEVLALFDDLHRQGLTLVVVTHDWDVAQRAGRIVTLSDGVIVEDRAVERGEEGNPALSRSVSSNNAGSNNGSTNRAGANNRTTNAAVQANGAPGQVSQEASASMDQAPVDEAAGDEAAPEEAQ
jgi:ABC-type methionine transport system ATPase subunit